MDSGANFDGAQPIAQEIALGEADHILVEDMGRFRTAYRKRGAQARQTGVVPTRDRLPSGTSRREASLA